MKLEYELAVEHEGAELARYSVPPGEYVIGRARYSSISILVGPVSRTHARLIVGDDGAVHVEDLGSANGTHLDDEPLTAPARWSPGQRLRVGDVTLTLSTVDSNRDTGDYAPTLSPSQFEAMPQEEPTQMSPKVALENQEFVRQHLPLVARDAQRIEVQKEVARGGMGMVLAARESATRRTVALKVMLRPDQRNETMRFIEEAQITAQLEHPNIVPVYDLGIDEKGQPYYTMKLVSGITLKKVLDEMARGNQEMMAKYPLGTLLTIFQKVCDAVAYAHSKGVIHRDLKPANFMIGRYGEVMVMDWGLAKIIGTGPTKRVPKPAAIEESVIIQATIKGARREESHAYGTMAGSLMGTPHYMSPEQARGEADVLDPRSDIFTLGVILYEILTLTRPFASREFSQVLEKVTTVDCETPRQRAKKPLPHLPEGQVPESLDAVVRQAMSLDPADRYARAEDLQADLTAYQNGFATSAERAGAWKMFKLYIARNRKAATAVAAGLVLLALSSAAFTWQVMRARDRAQAGEASASHQARVAELSAEAAQLVNLAQTQPEDALLRAMLAVERSRELLGAVTPAVKYSLTSALEAHRLEARISTGVDGSQFIAWDEDSHRAAVFGGNRQCVMLDVDTGSVIARTPNLSDLVVRNIAVSEGARRVVAAGDSAKIGVWTVAPGREDGIVKWVAHESWTRAVHFLPGGEQVLSVGANGEVRTWDLTGDKQPGAWQVRVGGGKLGITVLNAAAHRLVTTSEGVLSTEVFAVELGADGGEPQVTPLLGHSANITALALSGDGRFVGTGDADGTVRIWTFEGRLVGGPFQANRGMVEALAFSPDGNTIASRGSDRQALVFTHQGVALHGPFLVEALRTKALAQTEDAHLLVGENNRLDLYNLLGMESAPPIVSDNTLEDIIVAKEGTRLVAIDGQGDLFIWDAATHEQLVRQHVVEGRGQFVAESPDGSMLACSTRTGNEVSFVGFDGARAGESLRFEKEEQCTGLAFAPDGRLLAGTTHGELVFHDPQGRSPQTRIPLGFPPEATGLGADLLAGKSRVLVRAIAKQPLQFPVRYLWFDWSGRKLSEAGVDLDSARNFNASSRNGAILPGDREAMEQYRRGVIRWPVDQIVPRAENYIRLDTVEEGVQLVPLDGDTFGYSVFGGSLRLYNLAGQPISPWLRRDRYHLDSIVPLGDGRTFATGGGDRRMRFWHYGLDGWMQAAAQRLARSARVSQPQSEVDQRAAALVRQLNASAPAPVRTTRVPTSGAKTAAAPDVLPAGYTPLPNTSLAVALPEKWRLADAGSISLFNKLLSGLGYTLASRQGEVEVMHALVPEGAPLRDLFLSGSMPGVVVFRFDGGVTASDLIRMASKRLGILRGQVGSPLFASFKVDVQFGPSAGVTKWNEALDTGYWDFAVQTASGEHVVFRSYLLPTREAGYIILYKSVERDGKVQFEPAEQFLKAIHVAPAIRVDANFRAELRAAIEEQAAVAQAQAELKQRSDEFVRLRDQANRLIDEGKLVEAEPLRTKSLAIATDLEKVDAANAGKWALEGARARDGFGSRLMGKGQVDAGRALIEEGLTGAQRAVDLLKTLEPKGTIALLHLRRAYGLKRAGDLPASAAEYVAGMDLIDAYVAAGGVNPTLLERAVEAGNEWFRLHHDQKQPAEARAAFARILMMSRRLMELSSRTDALRSLFDDAHMNSELGLVVGGTEEASTRTREIIDLLKAQENRTGLDANTVVVMARYTARVQIILDRNPKSEFFPPKELAKITLFWIDRMKSFGPLTMEQDGWRIRAEVIAQDRTRGPNLPRPESATAQQIDLSKHYTCGLDQQGVASDPRYCLAMLPDGVIPLDGVLFDVRGMVQLSGKSVPKDRVVPDQVTGLQVKQRCAKIHVLQATNWTERDPNTRVASYVLHYADGQKAELPVVYGADLRDWNAGSESGQPTPKAKIAWTGPGGGGTLRLFHRTYDNPRPGVEVSTIDFVSAQANCSPFVVAITVE